MGHTLKHPLQVGYALWQLKRYYRGVDGYRLLAEHGDDHTLYGDVAFEPFYQLLRRLRLSKGASVYDLGSGVGRAVSITAMVSHELQAVGVERVFELHQAAVSVHQQLPAMVKQRMRLLHSDLFAISVVPAHCVFINATAWDPSVWQALEEKLVSELTPGCRVLCVSKCLHHSRFNLQWQLPLLMAYGPAHVSCYEVV